MAISDDDLRALFSQQVTRLIAEGNDPGSKFAPRHWFEQGLLYAHQLAPYASHLSNCDFDSWSPQLTSCSCGLFQLLSAIHWVEPKRPRT